MSSSAYYIKNGHAAPLGCVKKGPDFNFALFSKHATSVQLCLYIEDHDQPFLEVDLDPKVNKTGSIWHVLISNLPPQTEYGYRIDGPYDPDKGLLFNKNFILTDPYAKSLTTSNHWKDQSLQLSNFSPRARVLEPSTFDWENDTHPLIPDQDLIIYEMHVRGFTCHASSHATHPGTFLGIIEKIPHFKTLGINAIELMPIHEFNELENQVKNPKTGDQLCNFWGYSSINFFCPMNRYASSPNPGAALFEFKTMVKELHKNGIEVILDVVYNHTAEVEDLQGHYFSFKGIDNPVYYLLGHLGQYLNFSGCGNTINANHPVVAKLILESLRYWVSEMHVDGFRFDLASILTRGLDGEPLKDPPLIHAIAEDPLLKHTKMIAEPWDAAGLYQVGHFPGKRAWSEWNGKYRDDVRSFIKGTDDQATGFVTRVCGSSDLYKHTRKPTHSINFITAHDGYTLNDLVCYQDKHNEENGEDNRDGNNDNINWNCGVEGPTSDESIQFLRQRQMRNFHLALMLSIGTPMLLMGDEYGHTRNGNNNTWCQDNELNWFLWDELNVSKDFLNFYCRVIHFRQTHPILRRASFLTDHDIDWHGHLPFKPDWGPQSRFVAYTLKDSIGKEHLYVAFNANFEAAAITLPNPPAHKHWYQIIDTSVAPPNDFMDNPKTYPPVQSPYNLPAYTAFVAKAL